MRDLTPDELARMSPDDQKLVINFRAEMRAKGSAS
jgi:hypothetical protein